MTVGSTQASLSFRSLLGLFSLFCLNRLMAESRVWWQPIKGSAPTLVSCDLFVLFRRGDRHLSVKPE